MHGGLSFLLIMFNDYQEVFLLKSSILYELYQQSLNGGRKSIPYSFFKENAEQILQALQEDEKQTQEKVKEQQAQKAKRYRVEKDW